MTGRIAHKQPGSVPLCGQRHGGMRGLSWVAVKMGSLVQNVRSVGAKPDKLLSRFVLLVLHAETFEFEPEHVPSRTGELAADGRAEGSSDDSPQGSADDRQSLLGDRL